jgi:hypothetical protein
MADHRGTRSKTIGRVKRTPDNRLHSEHVEEPACHVRAFETLRFARGRRHVEHVLPIARYEQQRPRIASKVAEIAR